MDKQLEMFMAGQISDPFTVLGAHAHRQAGQSGTIYRAYIPGAKRVMALLREGDLELARVHEGGLFEAFRPGPHVYEPYRLKADFGTAGLSTFYDAYSFNPVLSEYDLFLWNQGNHYQIYHKLGAHPMVHQGVAGVAFAVWAPSAKKVSLVGDGNFWDGRRHPL
ncbi:hypothetical protein LJB86_03780, partial [Deltaproteobacteria bacterium OttesenSCG-928-M10]|nr:hypothetical protein [Deltaproteobacteria bacterium OttesenSCG-928-M10]